MADVTDAAPHRVTVVGSDASFEVAPGERILSAARRAGTWLPFECGWGSCGTCKVTVLEGETELLYDDAPSVDPRDARRKRVLACQSTATTDLSIRALHTSDEPSAERPVRDHVGRLVGREDLGPDLARFRFRLGAVAAYRPGQHAIVDLGDGLRRCYSLAGLPGSEEVELVAKRYLGRAGSERLFSLPLGRTVRLELPYGDMYLRDGDDPVVLVAGGTGISAILALARHLAAGAGAGRQVSALYGAGTLEELVCWDDLVESVGRLADGRVHGSLLHPGPTWTGHSGFVTGALAERLAGLTNAVFYVAGPPVMTEATVTLLTDNGIQLTHIHYDSFG